MQFIFRWYSYNHTKKGDFVDICESSFLDWQMIDQYTSCNLLMCEWTIHTSYRTYTIHTHQLSNLIGALTDNRSSITHDVVPQCSSASENQSQIRHKYHSHIYLLFAKATWFDILYLMQMYTILKYFFVQLTVSYIPWISWQRLRKQISAKFDIYFKRLLLKSSPYLLEVVYFGQTNEWKGT